AGQGLAQTKYVRRCFAMLASKPFSAPTKPGVDFVQDKQRAMFIAKAAEQWEEFRRGNVDAAADLDWFGENRADFLPAKQALDSRFDSLQSRPDLSGTIARFQLVTPSLFRQTAC